MKRGGDGVRSRLTVLGLTGALRCGIVGLRLLPKGVLAHWRRDQRPWGGCALARALHVLACDFNARGPSGPTSALQESADRKSPCFPRPANPLGLWST